MQGANPSIIGQKRSPEIPNPVLAINRYERVLSIHVCLSLRDECPRLNLNAKLIQAFNSLVSGSLEPSPVIVAYIL